MGISNIIDKPAFGILTADITSPFEYERFTISRSPVKIGTIDDHVGYMNPIPCCRNMLVKIPDGDMALPEPYPTHKGCAEVIAMCLAFEKLHIPERYYNECYAYLTVDWRKVEAGKTHRQNIWHPDGFQGARYKKKLPACRGYLAFNTLPTEFAVQPFSIDGLDVVRDNWQVAFAKQVQPESVFIPEAFEVHLMSAYQIHRPAVSPIEQDRCFIRLEFSHKIQDDLGNTENPLLKGVLQFQPRPFALMVQAEESSWEGASVFKA